MILHLDKLSKELCGYHFPIGSDCDLPLYTAQPGQLCDF